MKATNPTQPPAVRSQRVQLLSQSPSICNLFQLCGSALGMQFICATNLATTDSRLRVAGGCTAMPSDEDLARPSGLKLCTTAVSSTQSSPETTTRL